MQVFLLVLLFWLLYIPCIACVNLLMRTAPYSWPYCAAADRSRQRYLGAVDMEIVEHAGISLQLAQCLLTIIRCLQLATTCIGFANLFAANISSSAA